MRSGDRRRSGAGIPALAVGALVGALLGLAVMGSDASAQMCDPHSILGYADSGEAVAILLDFGPNSTVVTVFVVLQEGFTRPWVASQVALDITISSVDGINHFHGTDMVPLSDAPVVATSDDLDTVSVPWTVDEQPEVVGDLYTVCVQLVSGATPLGPQLCTDFGPFF